VSIERRECVDKLVSVIIPIYNVERYLRRCVDSVLNQTYKNLEIILIDDGSTDDGGRICDEYSEEDQRVVCIHKTNGGLSDARNAGLDIASGEYLMFVDSDDWIHRKTIEILVTVLEKNNADLSFCCEEKVADFKIDKQILDIACVIDSCQEIAIRDFVKESFVTAWGKVYKSYIWNELRFPIGKVHEDEFVFHRFSFKANKIMQCKETLYYYYQRPNSIIHTVDEKRSQDAIDAYIDRICFAEDNRWFDVIDDTVSLFSDYLIRIYEQKKNFGYRFRKNAYKKWKKVLRKYRLVPTNKNQRLFYYSSGLYDLKMIILSCLPEKR